MAKPSRANFTLGATTSAHLALPYLRCAYSKPRGVPGTPTARQPKVESGVALPPASRYMSRVACSGALSRKSRNVDRPSAKRMSINPPPPRLPALGCVTAKANPTAAAASMALPPAFRIANPASVAFISRETTIAERARTGWAAGSGETRIDSKARVAVKRRMVQVYTPALRRLLQSNSATAVATETFSDAIAPAIGMLTNTSQCFATRSCRPRPSAPTTSAHGSL